jgi:hypothetical protein
VPGDARPRTKPAQAMTAPMMLTMSAGVFMVAPMFCLPPDVAGGTDSTIRAGRYCPVPTSTLRARPGIPAHGLV